MKSFDTDAAAKEYVGTQVDVPVESGVEKLRQGAYLSMHTQELDEGRFTNVYTLSFPSRGVVPSIRLTGLKAVYDEIKKDGGVLAASSGGFFFLADKASASPRQPSLNLAIEDGHIYGLPVSDREAILAHHGRLEAMHVPALGVLAINNSEVSWSGSLTGHDTEVKVFTSGNAVITHVHSDATGSIRVLDEPSRYTPDITDDDVIGIGFIRRDDGKFVGVHSSFSGGVDIFSHDIVLRMHERHSHRGLPVVTIRSIGELALDRSLQGALSIGPMYNEEDFSSHPINKDQSLGNKPPFLDVPLARTVIYETDDNMTHIRLFDGRPGSAVFPGVTPEQAAQQIGDDKPVTWGCFLDPGQTAKLVVRNHDEIASYGNRHYLKWPKQPGEKYIWAPNTGRPVGSMIILH